MKPLAILAAAFLLGAPGHARDREFDAIVRRIEARCDTPHARIPFLGVANFFVKFARPAGVSDMKLAVFPDLRRPLFAGEDDFTRLAAEALGPDWRPFLRVQDQRTGEWTCIYAGGSGKHAKLLIATMEQREATLLRLKLNPEAMLRWILQPREELRNRHRRD